MQLIEAVSVRGERAAESCCEAARDEFKHPQCCSTPDRPLPQVVFTTQILQICREELILGQMHVQS